VTDSNATLGAATQLTVDEQKRLTKLQSDLQEQKTREQNARDKYNQGASPLWLFGGIFGYLIADAVTTDSARHDIEEARREQDRINREILELQLKTSKIVQSLQIASDQLVHIQSLVMLHERIWLYVGGLEKAAEELLNSMQGHQNPDWLPILKREEASLRKTWQLFEKALDLYLMTVQ